MSCFAYTTFLAWFVDEASGAADFKEDKQESFLHYNESEGASADGGDS